MITPATFAEMAPILELRGYQPVPIKPGFKAPMLDDWQTPRPPEYYLPHRNPDTGKVTDCRSWGTGILTATCPAIDLDIRDRELVRVLLELAAELIDYTSFRIGRPPKGLLPFSTRAPFNKVQGRWFALPGEDFRAAGYAAHRIEVLGEGQQLVAFAVHPGTGRPYRWRRGSPLLDYRMDLPELTEASARAFLWAAQAVMRECGAIPLRRERKDFWPDAWQDVDLGPPKPVQPARHRSTSGERFDSSWQRLEPQELARLIDAKHARRLRDGGWITSCPAHRSEGHRSLSITPRDGGGSIVHCFAGCTFAELAREITGIVRSATP
jgi:hypothetical protein